MVMIVICIIMYTDNNSNSSNVCNNSSNTCNRKVRQGARAWGFACSGAAAACAGGGRSSACRSVTGFVMLYIYIYIYICICIYIEREIDR